MADLVKVVCVRLPEWAVAQLREWAAEDKRTIGQLARVILETRLEERKRG